MVQETQQIKVVLTKGPDGEALAKPIVLFVEAAKAPGEQEVSSRTVDSLNDVLVGIQAVSGAVVDTVKAVRPDKFSIELGFEVKSEAGGLVAMLVRAGGSASLKVTLEWARDDGPAAAATGG
jgi:hypothetical protein